MQPAMVYFRNIYDKSCDNISVTSKKQLFCGGKTMQLKNIDTGRSREGNKVIFLSPPTPALKFTAMATPEALEFQQYVFGLVQQAQSEAGGRPPAAAAAAPTKQLQRMPAAGLSKGRVSSGVIQQNPAEKRKLQFPGQYAIAPPQQRSSQNSARSDPIDPEGLDDVFSGTHQAEQEDDEELDEPESTRSNSGKQQQQLLQRQQQQQRIDHQRRQQQRSQQQQQLTPSSLQRQGAVKGGQIGGSSSSMAGGGFMRNAAAGYVTGANRSGAQTHSTHQQQQPMTTSSQRALQQVHAAQKQQQARGSSSSAAIAAAAATASRSGRAPVVIGSTAAPSGSSRSSSAGGASHSALLSRNTSMEQYAERQSSSDSSSRWCSYKHSPSSSAHVQTYLGGMRNLGNTCYLAAVLQALFSLPGFVDDLQVYTVTAATVSTVRRT
jgi:Ubiquitin carboxyl-terminal hydrolase